MNIWTGLDLCYSEDVWCKYIFGYFYAIFLSHFPVKFSVENLRKESLHSSNEKENDEFVRGSVITAAIIGLVERAMYVTFILTDSFQFIGIWIALKVAGQWGNTWTRTANLKESESEIKSELLQKYIIYGEDIYNIYLIGNGLSAIYSFIAVVLIQRCLEGEYIFLIIGIILLFVPWIFKFIIKYKRKLSSFLKYFDKPKYHQ